MGSGVTLDDSIQRLGDFCAVLKAANANLDTNTNLIGDHADHLQQVAGGAGDELQGLTDDSRAFDGRFEDADTTAEQSLEQAASEAHSLAETTLGGIDQGAEQREDAVEAALRADVDELDRTSTSTQSSYEALGATLEQARDEVGRVEDALEGAYDGLEGGLNTLGQEIETARIETVQAFADAGALLDGEDLAALHADGDAAASGWTDELPAGLESAAETARQSMVGAYESFGSGTLAAADELEGAVATAGREVAEALISGTGNELDMAAGALVSPSAETAQADVDALDAGIDVHEQTCQTLEPMIGELEKVRLAIGEIAALLEAMQ